MLEIIDFLSRRVSYLFFLEIYVVFRYFVLDLPIYLRYRILHALILLFRGLPKFR